MCTREGLSLDWDANPELYRFAARSLLAGLQKLQEEGRAVEVAGRWSAVAK